MEKEMQIQTREDTNKFLFKYVSCNSYFKKIRDGRHVDLNEDVRFCYKGLECEIFPECHADGSLDFVKTYYENRNCRQFTGVVVGIKDLVIDAYLVVDTGYHYDGTEFTYVERVPKTRCTVAIVYYNNNKKRFVPIEDILLI